MPFDTARAPHHEPVKQFALFSENKVGRLSEFVNLLGSHDIHVLAITTMDTTDCAIIRVIVDDPDGARTLLLEHGFPFTESDLLVVEMDAERELRTVLTALFAAEINIHYIYPFIFRPEQKGALAMNLEDLDLAAQALRNAGMRVLRQSDISR